MDKNLRSHLITAFTAALVSLFCSNAVMLYSQDDELDTITVLGEVIFDDWSGIRIIGKDDGTCPINFEIDGLFAGRYVVGTPSGGAPTATSGLPLTNQEVRRGGTSHNPPVLSGLGITTAIGNDDIVWPTATYTPPTFTYTRPTLTADNHGHRHTIGGNRTPVRYDLTSVDSGGVQIRHTWMPTINTSTNLGPNGSTVARHSLSGGGVSSSGGSVTLSGGSLNIDNNDFAISGTIVGGGAIDQLQPAPYVQIPICVHNPPM